MLKGIDISHWQGKPDFDKLKTQVDFIIIKATEGTNYVDTEFIRNQSEIRRTGLGLGYYHFARPEYNSAEAEADWFTSHLNIKDGELVVLDYESNWVGDVPKWSFAFLERVKSNLGGLKGLIYINKSLQKKYDWSRIVSGDYGLWLADYEGTGNSIPWSVTAMTQTSSKGILNGISDNSVDLDTFSGDINTFKSYGYKSLEVNEATPIVENLTPWAKIENFDQNTNSQYYKNKFYNKDWSIINDIYDRDLEIADFKNKSNILENNIINLQNQITDKTNELATSLSDIAILQSQYFDLKTENNRLVSLITDLQNQLAVLEQNKKDLKNELILVEEKLRLNDSVNQQPVETVNLTPEKIVTNKISDFIAERVKKLFSTRFLVAVGGSGAILNLINGSHDTTSVSTGIIGILINAVTYIYSEIQIKKIDK